MKSAPHHASETEIADDRSDPVMDDRERAAYLANLAAGVAALETGEYIDGEDMEAWVDSMFTPGALPRPCVRQRDKP